MIVSDFPGKRIDIASLAEFWHRRYKLREKKRYKSSSCRPTPHVGGFACFEKGSGKRTDVSGMFLISRADDDAEYLHHLHPLHINFPP